MPQTVGNRFAVVAICIDEKSSADNSFCNFLIHSKSVLRSLNKVFLPSSKVFSLLICACIFLFNSDHSLFIAVPHKLKLFYRNIAYFLYKFLPLIRKDPFYKLFCIFRFFAFYGDCIKIVRKRICFIFNIF